MDKKKVRFKLIIEGVIAIYIALTPLLYYMYKYIRTDPDNTWHILGITFTENGYLDVPTAIYFYISKLIPLTLLIIWFTTCKRWWYHTILIPIAMYAFQLYDVFSEDAGRIDESQLLYILGVSMIIIPIVYFIRIKLFDKHVHGIDLEAMDAELKELKEKARLREEKKS